MNCGHRSCGACGTSAGRLRDVCGTSTTRTRTRFRCNFNALSCLAGPAGPLTGPPAPTRYILFSRTCAGENKLLLTRSVSKRSRWFRNSSQVLDIIRQHRAGPVPDLCRTSAQVPRRTSKKACPNRPTRSAFPPRRRMSASRSRPMDIATGTTDDSAAKGPPPPPPAGRRGSRCPASRPSRRPWVLPGAGGGMGTARSATLRLSRSRNWVDQPIGWLIAGLMSLRTSEESAP